MDIIKYTLALASILLYDYWLFCQKTSNNDYVPSVTSRCKIFVFQNAITVTNNPFLPMWEWKIFQGFMINFFTFAVLHQCKNNCLH